MSDIREQVDQQIARLAGGLCRHEKRKLRRVADGNYRVFLDDFTIRVEVEGERWRLRVAPTRDDQDQDWGVDAFRTVADVVSDLYGVWGIEDGRSVEDWLDEGARGHAQAVRLGLVR